MLVSLMVVLLLACNADPARSGPKAYQSSVRKAAVAGQFYPEAPLGLQQDIAAMLENASPPQTKGVLTALIVPHAGYRFSGQVAANGFKKAAGADIDTVILVGNSHREFFEGIAVYPDGYFETPLGRVAVDSELSERLIGESGPIRADATVHAGDHVLEVELPFLQTILKNFKIVPVLFGNAPDSGYEVLARAIIKHAKDKKVLLVASSDLSHYPDYKGAKKSDGRVIKAVLSGDPASLDGAIKEILDMRIKNEVTCACGADAIKTAMAVAKGLGASEIKLLGAANSGDVSGDKQRVVGYASVGFFAEKDDRLLGPLEQRTLLKIARTSVEALVRTGRIVPPANTLPALEEKLGAFVTLRERGRLRGCIGRFSPTDIPLYQVVANMAVSAATEDMRFSPVETSELKDIRYEISVLSPLKRISDPSEIKLGRDGVKVYKDGRSGVFLPQVATETGWNLDQFMGELCSQKAGLPSDCWKNPSTQLYTFTAQVFGEEEAAGHE